MTNISLFDFSLSHSLSTHFSCAILLNWIENIIAKLDVKLEIYKVPFDYCQQKTKYTDIKRDKRCP